MAAPAMLWGNRTLVRPSLECRCVRGKAKWLCFLMVSLAALTSVHSQLVPCATTLGVGVSAVHQHLCPLLTQATLGARQQGAGQGLHIHTVLGCGAFGVVYLGECMDRKWCH